MNINKYKLKTRDLRKKSKSSSFHFQNTSEIKPVKGIIGQDRAVSAINLGLDINGPGYNIYIAGSMGTGKSTLAKEMLEKRAKKRPVPSDWCYIYNFDNPGMPRAIKVPSGIGKELKHNLADRIEKIIEDIVNAINGDEFAARKNDITNNLVTDTNTLYLELDQEARKHGFTITQTQGGLNAIPITKDGEVMAQEEYVNMPEQDRAEMMARNALIQEKMHSVLRKYRELEMHAKERVKNLEQETSRDVADPHFSYLFDIYSQFDEVIKYLQAVQKDFLEHVDSFIQPEENAALNFFRNIDKRAFLRRYQVNLLVDNSELKHAPVIFATNPTFANLFGQIEYEGEFGVLATDFSKIRAGAFHRANGGYLVLQVNDLLKNYYVWDMLKRVLKNREIRVENISRMLGITNTETLEPESIPLDVKVVLIGDSVYYYLLYQYDEEFRKLFKIRADFDQEMERSRKHVNEYARFIGSVCQERGLRHFTPEAVAAIVDYGSRMADNQNKLSTAFNKLLEIIYEADCQAAYDKAEYVAGEHVSRAIKDKKIRNSMIEDKLQEAINKDTIIINISGTRIGELNGLAVYQIGETCFGKPVRITAKTFMGEKGVVNIERETMMSGRIHSKGVLTLSGYLGAQYAQDKPLALSASVTFEQSYSGIDGDSASSAELYTLISSLAKVPLKQGIAVTGSVNQNGEIQPVGGVNEKIEGFFKVCQERGLDGTQGVIIPVQNVDTLMLNEEVIAAVQNRLFNIYAVEHINQGLEILTGIEAGERNERGMFPAESVHNLADQQLGEWSSRKGYMGEPRKSKGNGSRFSAVKKRRRRKH